MKFLIDAQLSSSLAQWLRSAGYEAVHVEDVGLRSVEDRFIRDYVAQHGLVLITKDKDFVPVNEMASPGIQIVWIRTGNVPNRVLLARFAKEWPALRSHLDSGARIVEVR